MHRAGGGAPLGNKNALKHGLYSAEAIEMRRAQGFIDGGYLVGERNHIRAVNRHHRIEQECKVDPFGFARELERAAVAVERKWAFSAGHSDRVFVCAPEEAFLHRAIGGPVNDLDRAFTKFDRRYDRRDSIRLNT
jgi:hypothetical protein